MRFRLHGFRWAMLVLYSFLLLTFLLLGLGFPHEPFLLVLAGATVVSQFLFLFGAGTRDLARPVRKKRRLLAPALMAAAMMAILLGALGLALNELFLFRSMDELLILSAIVPLWIFWSVFFFIHTRNRPRFLALRRLTRFVMAGSLAELLACIPAHLIVIRRPGCLVGLDTAAAVAAGVYVMLWSFGPGILLLFLRPRYEAECAKPPDETAEARPSYSLAGLTLATVFIGACMALVFSFEEPLPPWLRWEFWLAFAAGAALLYRFWRKVRRWEREGTNVSTKNSPHP